jgi:hypothetical protein
MSQNSGVRSQDLRRTGAQELQIEESTALARVLLNLDS